MSYVMFYKK